MATAAERNKLRAQRLRAEGRCRGCGGETDDKAYCLSCRDRRAMQMRELSTQRRAQGLCPKHGIKPRPGRVKCERCAGMDRSWYQQRIGAAGSEARRCPQCGVELSLEHRWVKCLACRGKEAERQRKRLNRFRASGLCQRCGKVELTDDGYRTCADCRAKQRETNRRRLEEARALGLCSRCPTPVEAGTRYCPRCLGVYQERMRKLVAENRCTRCGAEHDSKRQICPTCVSAAKAEKEERKIQGKCLRCKADAARGYVHCQPCRDVMAAQSRKRESRYKALGKCPRCGSEVSEGVRCRSCRERDKRIRADRKARGMCTQCGTRPVRAGAICQECRAYKRRYKTRPDSATERVFLDALIKALPPDYACGLEHQAYLDRDDGGLPLSVDLLLPYTEPPVAIEYNGCYWHQHGCGAPPLAGEHRKRRDLEEERVRLMGERGWLYLPVWECEIEVSKQRYDPSAAVARVIAEIVG